MRQQIGLTVAIGLAVSLMACGGAEPPATAAATAVSTPNIELTVEAAIQATTEASPTVTPLPTSTPIPTSIPLLAATLIPTVEPTVTTEPTPTDIPTEPASPTPTYTPPPTVPPTPTSIPPTNTPVPTPIVTLTTPTEPLTTGWLQIAQWTGQSIKDTETFYVGSSQWRLNWDTQPGQYGAMNFQIYVYKADGTPHGNFVVANVIGADQDSSVIRGSGDFYLTINTGQPYTITVDELSTFIPTLTPTPAPTTFLDLQPASGPPGTLVKVVGVGFRTGNGPLSELKIGDVDVLPIPVPRTTSGGAFVAQFMVPNLSAGEFIVQATVGTETTEMVFTVSSN